ncbi:MAG: hypothetical protein GY822_03450 [Deltaproteobacteria bacterium]|nr:hypothetical protein [Deltaproteobacteria bacterium]
MLSSLYCHFHSDLNHQGSLAAALFWSKIRGPLQENELLPQAQDTYKVQDIGKGPFALIPVSALNAQKGQALKVDIEEGAFSSRPKS